MSVLNLSVRYLAVIWFLIQSPCFSKIVSWEAYAKAGNKQLDRARLRDSKKSYMAALKILDEAKADDLRHAVVLKDLGRAYTMEGKIDKARFVNGQAAVIYAKEIENNQLGPEYKDHQAADLTQIVLRPACLLCHDNSKVVPIRYDPTGCIKDSYGKEKNLLGKEFFHSGGSQVGDERWYCKACKQAF